MKIIRILWRSFLGLTLFFGFLFISLLGVTAWWLSDFPTKATIRGCLTTQLHQVKLCPNSGNYAPLSAIAKTLQQTVVLSEDASFWQHSGFDFYEIQKSFERNLGEGRFARGGSTITQQLAKNMFLNADKNMGRKLKEAIITFQIEKALSKKEILERYLNIVEFGPNIFGVKQAAQVYFRKTPAQISWMEAAYLAHLLPNPKVYSRTLVRQELTAFAYRQVQRILRLALLTQRMSTQEYEQAIAEISERFPKTSRFDSQQLENATDPEPPASESQDNSEEDVESR